MAFTTWPGVTGLLITLSLILMVTTAVDQIRRNYFELFWWVCSDVCFSCDLAFVVLHGDVEV
jgi:NADPH oxidase